METKESWRCKTIVLSRQREEHSRTHVVCHRVETVFLLNRDNSNFFGNRPLMGVDKEDFLIAGKGGSKFWDQLVHHDGIYRMAELVQTILIRLEDIEIRPFSDGIEDVEGNPIIPAIRISIPDDQYLVSHSV